MHTNHYLNLYHYHSSSVSESPSRSFVSVTFLRCAMAIASTVLFAMSPAPPALGDGFRADRGWNADMNVKVNVPEEVA